MKIWLFHCVLVFDNVVNAFIMSVRYEVKNGIVFGHVLFDWLALRLDSVFLLVDKVCIAISDKGNDIYDIVHMLDQMNWYQ